MIEIPMYTVGIYILFGSLAFFCEYIDSALGGGYGTILVPVLLFFNIEGAILIPTVLFTQMVAGFLSAFLHHCVGNANFRFQIKSKQKIELEREEHNNTQNPDIPQKNSIKKTFSTYFDLSADFKISAMLSVMGIIGGVCAAFLAINVNPLFVRIYIGVLVTLVGVFVFLKLKWKFAWWKISFIGLIAAFNKGLSGGGYGPLISSGQMIVDRNPRQAVASTALSEAVVCISSLLIYFTINGLILNNSLGFLVLALLVGSLASVPLAVLTIKYINAKKLQPIIGIGTILLGIFTLIRSLLM